MCESLGKTREEFGIIAKARATMYFSGGWNSVSFDAIEDLAKHGTDIIFIEKIDVVDLLSKYADKYGIALVDTQGFLTDYGRDLINSATAEGGNTAIVSDWDASGIRIAHDAGDIPRLGIDQEMLDHFGLNRNSPTVSVPMHAKIDVMTPIKGLVDADAFNFLSTRKVEIDAVIAVVGSERFWEYLIEKLKEYYPTRDYTRVINPEPVTSEYYPPIVLDLQTTLGKYIKLILEEESSNVEEELSEVEGFIEDISEKRKEIYNRYK
ncbi:MAG: hypothetical protein ACRD4B_04235, partial [Acidobacteriota bacterium]